MNLVNRLAAEAIGTAFLLAAVVGSGIMGARLSGGNEAIALLANSIATGGALFALITAVAPISGAHFNPAVSLIMAVRGDLAWKDLPVYVAAQLSGAILGVIAAHAMFDLPLVELSTKARPGLALAGSEFVATLGLLLLILNGSRQKIPALPAAIACYIMAAYWFTASTSFANPAVTLARTLTNSFTGIRPADIGGFLLGEVVAAAVVVVGLKLGTRKNRAITPSVLS